MGDVIGSLFGLLFCLVLIPLGIGAIGYRMGERAAERRGASTSPPPSPVPTPQAQTPVTPPDSQDERIRWLLWQLQRKPMATTLTTEQRIQLTREYAGRLQDTELLRTLAGSLPGPEADAIRAAHPEIFDQRPVVPATPSEAATGPEMPAPVSPPVGAVSQPARQETPATGLEGPARLDDDEPVTHGRALDPAVMLLYVGALMVVA